MGQLCRSRDALATFSSQHLPTFRGPFGSSAGQQRATRKMCRAPLCLLPPPRGDCRRGRGGVQTSWAGPSPAGARGHGWGNGSGRRLHSEAAGHSFFSEARADFSHRRWRRPLACRSRRRPASVPGREDVSPSGFTGGPPRRAGAARQALAEAPRGGLLPLPRLPAGGRPWLWRRWASSAEYCFCTHVSLALTSDRARQGCRCLAREIFCPHLFLAFRGVHR